MSAFFRVLAVPVVVFLLLIASCTGETMVAPTEADFEAGLADMKSAKKSSVEAVLNAANGNYYEAVADPGVTWSDARAAAMNKYRGCDGHLATITSQGENDFITTTFPEVVEQGYWLGGAQDGSFGEPAEGWGWITGEPFVFTNWATGEPNDAFDPNDDFDEEALHFFPPFFGPQGDPGTWNDQNGEESDPLGGYVVEYDCPPKGGVVEHVTGSGHFTVLGELRTFSFNARKYGNGMVEGEWQLNNRAIDADAHGNVTCFTVEGNQAWLGGFAEDGIEGDVGWTVADNGEGANSPPDQISLQWVARPLGFASAYCTATPVGAEPYALNLNDVESGNIQIK